MADQPPSSCRRPILLDVIHGKRVHVAAQGGDHHVPQCGIAGTTRSGRAPSPPVHSLRGSS